MFKGKGILQSIDVHALPHILVILLASFKEVVLRRGLSNLRTCMPYTDNLVRVIYSIWGEGILQLVDMQAPPFILASLLTHCEFTVSLICPIQIIL